RSPTTCFSSAPCGATCVLLAAPTPPRSTPCRSRRPVLALCQTGRSTARAGVTACRTLDRNQGVAPACRAPSLVRLLVNRQRSGESRHERVPRRSGRGDGGDGGGEPNAAA